jgi:hypothetical protein
MTALPFRWLASVACYLMPAQCNGPIASGAGSAVLHTWSMGWSLPGSLPARVVVFRLRQPDSAPHWVIPLLGAVSHAGQQWWQPRRSSCHTPASLPLTLQVQLQATAGRLCVPLLRHLPSLVVILCVDLGRGAWCVW